MAVSNVELRVNATQAVAALRKVNKGATTFNQTVNGTSGQLKQANKGFSILPPALLATGAGAKVAAGGFATSDARGFSSYAIVTIGYTQTDFAGPR